MELLRIERPQPPTPQQPMSQDMITHVVVPLIQNIAGGIAGIILAYILFLVAGRINATPVNHDSATFWSITIGTIIATLATLTRFFSDDIGIVTTAYRAGGESRQDEINRLANENAALKAAINGQQRPTASATPSGEKIDRIRRSQHHAIVMLENGIRGRPIDRRTCKSTYNIGEVDFGRAYRLLQEAGIRDQQDTFTTADLRQARTKLNQYYTYHYQIAASNPNYNPPWL